jgi:hypothetical protein
MSGGSGNFIGGPWLLIRRVVVRRDSRVTGLQQLAQARAAALCNLAVLLGRPAMASTERGAAAPGDLMDEDKLLIGAELARSRHDATQLAAHDHQRLEIRAAVNERRVARLACRDRHSRGQRGADRAATRECAPKVSDSGHHAQLERVRDVRVARKRVATPRLGEQLERRLGVTVLEILPTQHPPVRAQQHLALGLGDPGDCVLLRTRPLRARSAGSSLAATSSRHIRMSTPAAHKPPCEFRGDRPHPRLDPGRGRRR